MKLLENIELSLANGTDSTSEETKVIEKLPNLRDEIFKLILICIKNNIKSCETLAEYPVIFEIQELIKSTTISKILVEIFKYCEKLETPAMFDFYFK